MRWWQWLVLIALICVVSACLFVHTRTMLQTAIEQSERRAP